MSKPIYLDYNATTPIAREVLEAMTPALRETWGNPGSVHAYGAAARAAMERAREQVASLLGCWPDEVIFTGGGTESDNAAIVGVAEALADRGRHIVTTVVEHPAIEQACVYLESRGWEVTRVGVDRLGLPDPDEVESALRSDTVLVSVMHANNESGVLLPVAEIGRRVHEREIVFHSDAAQSVGKIPVNVAELNVDLLTVAGHKFYAPKGIGALYARRGTPIAAFIHGGGQEAGRRSGTENVALMAGLGAACALASAESERRPAHMAAMRDRLEARLKEKLGEIVVHGAGAERLPNTLYVAIPDADAARLLDQLDGVATAAGAACHGGETEPSRVLLAMGVPDELARCTLRLTVGRPTTEQQIDEAADLIAEAAANVR